jgi:hypothetical protein
MITGPDDRLPSIGLLMSLQFDYEIKSWESGIIEATGQTRAADLRLSIELSSSTVRRTSIETEARGAKTANPQREDWILR